MKRGVPLIITFVVGFVLIFSVFIPPMENLGENFTLFFDIIAVFAFFLGGGNLLRVHLTKLTRRKRHGPRTINGLNFFEPTEQALLRALQRPEFNIRGLRRADIKPFVPLSDSALSRQLHRLRALGLIKRVSRSYRYYLTRLGRAAIAAACSLTQFRIIPAMAHSR